MSVLSPARRPAFVMIAPIPLSPCCGSAPVLAIKRQVLARGLLPGSHRLAAFGAILRFTERRRARVVPAAATSSRPALTIRRQARLRRKPVGVLPVNLRNAAENELVSLNPRS